MVLSEVWGIPGGLRTPTGKRGAAVLLAPLFLLLPLNFAPSEFRMSPFCFWSSHLEYASSIKFMHIKHHFLTRFPFYLVLSSACVKICLLFGYFKYFFSHGLGHIILDISVSLKYFFPSSQLDVRFLSSASLSSVLDSLLLFFSFYCWW